ncbi:metallophosphoesterase [Novosphingobium nitrogenifigens DSM 19370]|uniref:Metallophosphoesterase n=1 Tax=Novosphingobium nitrogenifigens DSM 19370 TaxID=983920 RepID=F1Z564_9SPHN|nr:metallophosphoesterase [Novosphingobium nitrogenifigens]EGD60030.1 metallophosphoesterase [Novosphingobium nitrogenifigens DSM 19370]
MIRLFHISDLHFGLEDRRALEWLVGLVRAERPEGVVITGDFTMRARPREFAAAAQWIGELGVPVTLDPGNHDLPYFNPVERFVDPYRRFRALEAGLGAKLDLPGLALVRLPTTARAQWRLNWSKGCVGAAALARTLATLDALPKDTPAIVTCHHPLVEAGTRGQALTRGGERALAELARRQVLAVLSGHVHDAFDLVRETAHGPIRMIGAGTLSQRLRTTPPTFNELVLADGQLECRPRRLDGVGAETFGRYR